MKGGIVNDARLRVIRHAGTIVPMLSRTGWRRGVVALIVFAARAAVALPTVELPDPGPASGLADSKGLRATVYGPLPQDLAPLPARVPLEEMDIALPWAKPLPEVLWFARRLRVWFAAQPGPAPLAILISGTGGDGNTQKLATLRAVLYGAGYHVLTLPSPTFPGFIAAASSTGVAGDLHQDSLDLYRAIEVILAHLPSRVRITDIDTVGYSLGGANAAVVKSIDAVAGRVHIHRAVMINPPVSLFASMSRLDRLFALDIGSTDEGIERLYRKLYARLANWYRSSDRVQIDESALLEAAGAVLQTDADFEAAIALTFRLDLVNVFFAGDLYAGTGVVVDPKHPPHAGDSLEEIGRALRRRPFADYFDKVFAPYYLRYRPGTTREALLADSRLDIIAEQLSHDPDYYAQTNSDDLILDAVELGWLRRTLGERIAVYDHGGHLGTLGERQQVADLLDMLAGRWRAQSR